ncbi:integrase, catalytic region, zinc finger, CCHC-type containing protein [Tanacetum coccineum]|uniref:Integrase, catalytic region, zinc finger, CCHC-type containing protein n=1 Tax=Tanacetum coccineum TaxID=301880 RepID=A0ABQ5DG61_9ASTR
MSQDVIICVMNSTAVYDDSVNEEMQSSEFCAKYLDLDAKLLNKENAYNDLSKKYLENNALKAQLQAKDTTIFKLKEHIKSMRENNKEEKVKHDMDEIETINIELEHRSKDTNLYTISLDDMLKTSSICLLSKASKTKSWLWHRRLSHLNFGTLNKLAKDGLARGIPKLKFKKDHICSACALGKSKKSSHQPKAKDTNQEKLYLLHMDLCGPMRMESINGKKTRPVHRQPFNPPTRNDWDRLFQPMFSAISLVPVADAPRAVEIAATPSSTTIDQDAPSCTSSTNQQQQSSIISQGVEEPIPNAHFDDLCHEPLHDVSTFQESSPNT